MRKMCKVLGLREANYYRWKQRKKAREEKEKKERDLAETVRKVFLESRRVYGYRKMKRELEAQDCIPERI